MHIARRVLTFVVAGGVVLSTAGVSTAALVAAVPTVSALSATSGPVAGHGKVTVHGSGFTGVTAVLFGGARGGSVHVVSSGTLTVVVPAHKAARVDVRVVTSHGTSKASKHDVFAYVAAPAVKSVSVASGVLTGGVKVVVKGSGFTHVKKVLFGKAVGTKLHVASRSSLSVLAPAHVAGQVDVRVVSSYGTSAVKVSDRFTFTVPTVVVAPDPVITTTALPNAERGQPYTASIAVTDGTPPFTVTATGLPSGLSLSGTGALSGATYAAAAQYPVAVHVVDAAGHTASASLPLSVRIHAGQVYDWGDDNGGELGDGVTSTSPTTAPAAVAGMTTAVQVVGTLRSSYALMADGTVYAWGYNSEGELGDGTTTSQTTPEQIPGLSGIVSLAAGGHSVYALTSGGTLVAWGDNQNGRLGDGTATERDAPVAVVGPTHVVQVVAGTSSAYALQADGEVWAWGANADGQLGNGAVGVDSLTPALVPGLMQVTQLASKWNDAFALLSDGSVVGWGFNADGEVGDTTATQRNTPVPVYRLTGVTAIADAAFTGYALMADGTVRAWGQNAGGEIGDGTAIDRLSPVVVPGLTNVQTVTASEFHAFVAHPDGTVAIWGEGSDGSNADGTTVAQSHPEVNPTLAGLTAFGNGYQSGYAIR